MRTPTLTLTALLATAWSHAAAAEADPANAADFLHRQAQVDRNDPVALMDLGRWAEQRNLLWPAASVYVRVLELKPDHEQAYQAVSQIGDNARLPDEAATEKLLVEDLARWAPGFRAYSSPHFIIVYNTNEGWARNRGVLLEKTHRTFFDAFRKADLRPLPLGRRLVCVLFEEQADFKRYAAEIDNNHAAWAGGYYSSKTNRIAFYNDKSKPEFAEAKARIADLDRQIDQFNLRLKDPEVRRNNALKLQIGEDRKHAVDEKRFLENRIDAIANLSNASKTTHEATHQLAFNTGIMRAVVHYPFWIAEGLATNFEAAEPAANFGPFHDNPDRIARLRDAVDKRQLMPLNDFVALTALNLGQDEDRVRIHYAQAWGLFKFLFTKRHDQMRSYLRKLAALPPGIRTPDQMRQFFIDSFGPIDPLHDEWNAWLQRL